jgi:branched-chain amino acid transport system permease protein
MLFVAFLIKTVAVLVLTTTAIALIRALDRAYNFTVGGYMTVCPYLALSFSRCGHVPPLLAGAIAIMLTCLFAVCLEAAIFRRLRVGRGAADLYMVASLGAYTSIVGAVSLVWGTSARRLFFDRGAAYSLDAMSNSIALAVEMALATTVVSVVLAACLHYSRYGLCFRALACEPELAVARGARAEVLSCAAHGMAGAIAGLIGLFIARDVSMSPSMGMPVIVAALPAAVLARGSSFRAWAAMAACLGVIYVVVGYLLSAEWIDAVACSTVLAALFCVGRWRHA